MFVERSAARIRLARALFLLGGLAPFFALAGWAAVRHSPAHLAVVRRGAEQALGVPVEIGGVEHLRPNCLRLQSCRILSPSGAVVLAVPLVEVESTAAEVRLRLPEVECSPAAARALAAIAAGWLQQPVRHGRSWVVDVAGFSWGPAAGESTAAGGPPSSGLHVECVAAGDARAVRVRREPESADEVRVRSTFALGGENGRLEVSGTVGRPLPADVLAALVGPWGRGLESFGPEAIVSGGVDASCERGLWTGRITGVVERVDLAELAAGLQRHLGGAVVRLAGTATVAVSACEWREGRLDRCRLECRAGEGRMGQETLDSLVSTLGCRAGPAFRSLGGDDLRGFDSLSLDLDVDGRGTILRAGPGRRGALVRGHGLSLLDEPVGPVSMGRLAWFLSPSEPMAVPASDASAWLLSVLPSRAAAADATGTANPSHSMPAQAERPIPRGGF